jgi:secreted PhoX family phosphatase
MTTLDRRTFLKITSATSAALALGPSRWGWATEASPFGALQEDPLLRLPEGFSYKVIAETGMPLQEGRGPFPRPSFPDLNVPFRAGDGRVLLSTSHEVPGEGPVPANPPGEEYDVAASGAITSLLLDRELNVVEGSYDAGGMVSNCSGSGTPWGTVLTGEESTATLEADHGFIWEVDPAAHTKVRLDDCGRFDHETAVVDRATGFVYLTEDTGEGLLYRMRPRRNGKLAKGGMLEAFAGRGRWVRIPDPLGAEGKTPAAQGSEAGAIVFERLEGGRLDGRYFYFTETQDETACGKVWRLQVDKGRLELFAEGNADGGMCMPDNLVLDAAHNLYITEDKPTSNPSDPNRIQFIDRASGDISVFGEVSTPGDEATGPAFAPGGRAMFLNLQRSGNGGLTLVIEGPFPRRSRGRSVAALPRSGRTSEMALLSDHRSDLPTLAALPLGAAAALVNLRRRGRLTEDLPADLETAAATLGAPPFKATPKRA